LLHPRVVRISLVSEFFHPHPGGVTEHVDHLARYLRAAGHDVRIITSHVEGAPRRPDREHDGGVEIVRIGRGVPIEANGSQGRITVGLGLAGEMAAALDGCELVHVHSPLFPMLPYLAIKAAQRKGLPTVGTFHTHFRPSRALLPLGGVVARWARALDRCIAVSPSAARSVRQFVAGFSRGALPPVEVIPNGVDTAAWAAGRPRASLAGGPTIAFLGRLDPRNDLPVLLAAFARVREARPDAQLVIVGDGPRRNELAAIASRPGNVRFLGNLSSVSDRADVLASAQVLAFTARIVSHPMALLEGLAAGLPAVAYDIEGVRELVAEGRQGYKVPPGAAAPLAEALLRVLGDEPQRARMSLEAQRTAARYDWRIIGARVEAVYAAALHGAFEKGAA
jgi:phosphatidylinositol alpha-mannosyltransferase